jgi:hypothetical protein
MPNTKQKDAKTAKNIYKTIQKLQENDTELSAVDNATITPKQPKYIKKKKEYRTFIRLIKANKFTTAILTAKTLGVERNTINQWLSTKPCVLAMNETISKYISDIEVSKDWKAKAYLIDKIIPDDKKEENTVDLKQLIVINTK